MSAKAEFEKAKANLGGIGMACFLTHKEQAAAFNEGFKRQAIAAEIYIRTELEPEIERLRARLKALEPTV